MVTGKGCKITDSLVSLTFLDPLVSSVPLSLQHHAPDFLLTQPAAVVSDGDIVRPPGGFVLGRHVQNTVSIDIKGHFDTAHQERVLHQQR